MSRKETPDILGALMGEIEKPESKVAVKQESKRAIKPASGKAVKQASVVLIKPSFQKEKATFNLTKGLLSDLEDAWMKMRKMRGDKGISRTDIVENAVAQIIKEFGVKGPSSEIYRKLVSNKAIKQ